MHQQCIYLKNSLDKCKKKRAEDLASDCKIYYDISDIEFVLSDSIVKLSKSAVGGKWSTPNATFNINLGSCYSDTLFSERYLTEESKNLKLHQKKLMMQE